MTGGPETLLAAFVAGVVGSSHCAGMCGGIAAALGMATAGERAGTGRSLGHALIFNGARIGSYAVAGAIAGGLGLALGAALNAPVAAVILRTLTGLVLIAIGLQVAHNLRYLRPLELAGASVWRRLSKHAGGLLARRDLVGAVGLGALWGWLPCGLVYGMLFAAAGTGGPGSGAVLMIAFGLGTAPAMVAAGTLGAQFLRLRRHHVFRRVAGWVVIIAGLWTILGPVVMRWMMMSGNHAGHH